MTAVLDAEVVTAARTRARAPMLAGGAYAAAWLVGLALHPSGPALDAAGPVVAAHYASARWPLAVQSLLVHGVAAVALLFVAAGVAAAGRGLPGARLGRGAARLAAALSFVQAVLGVTAALTADTSDAARARWLFAAVGRLDGVKMLALGTMVAAGVALARRGVLPRWLGVAGAVLVAVVIPAAAGYLLLLQGPAVAAGPALLLLVVWVAGVGVATGRR